MAEERPSTTGSTATKNELSRTSKSSEEEVSGEKQQNDVESIIHRLASRISNCVGAEGSTQPSYNNPFQPLPGSKLDPQSSSFDTRAWVEALVHYESEDLDAGRRRKSGVAFRDLSVYGFGMSTDYQKTVGNSILSLTAPRRKRRVDILHGLDGLVNAGEMLLVLGPPGSGCSTLLKAIAGHMEGLSLGDETTMNYRGISFKEMHSYFRGEAIYVGENDVHLPMLSVGDTLSFAAHARAPRALPVGLKAQQYSNLLRDVIMAIFGISHTKTTVVGNDFIRGISGGERKRVSLAEAALSDAALQCWDNSTRGLDSANAVEFCKTLRTSTELLQTSVLVSLYQAPEEAYNIFDKVLLLYEGRQIFFGPTSEAGAYFEELGFQQPERQTTADFLTSMTSPKERRVRPGFERTVPKTALEFEERWKKSQQRQQLMRSIAEYERDFSLRSKYLDDFVESRRAQQASGQRIRSPYTLSYLQQTTLCLWRGWKRLLADPSLTYIQLGGNTIMALVLGSIFFNLHDDTNSFYGRGGLIFFALLLSAFASVLEILTLYEQRPVVEKHKQFALYHPSAEAVASMLTDIPYKLLNTLCFNLTLYLMANLRREAGPIFFFLLVAFLSTVVTSSLFRTIASVSRTMSQAMVPAAILVLGLIMYTGFTMPTAYMPGWSRWIAYVNPLSYAFESLMINEFHDRKFSCSVIVPTGAEYSTAGAVNRACTEVGNILGSTMVQGDLYIGEKFNYYHANKWRNVGILIAFWVLLTAAYLAATELLGMAKSKGEILLFRRSHFNDKRVTRRMAEANDEEALKPQVAPVALTGPPDATTRTHAPPSEGQVFHWQDVCYDVKQKGETRRILDHVDGWVEPGTLTALMASFFLCRGVSGAGKTTLLNVLADRVMTGVVTGDMYVDGIPRDVSFQRKTGYVQQQDVHLSTCTVRESLEFSALLRQPANVPPEEKRAYVDEVIRLLEMEEYADAIVGVPGEGLNIEQRRRLTVGVELAAKPELLLFLDEPTSGLDSQTSWAICQLLKRLARSGQAILCTIHQPSAILFEQFDNLLLLAKGGKTVYFGEIGQNSATLIQYLERNGGKQCPLHANPAEWMLEVIGAAPGSRTDVDWPQVWRDSHEHRSVKERLDEIRQSRITEDKEPPIQPVGQPKDTAYAAPFARQWWLVQKRVAAQYWRTPSYIYSKIALTVGSALFIGFSFFHAPNTIQGLQNQMYAVMMLLSMYGQLSEQIMPQFISQREVYEERERPSKIYDWKVLILSNLTIEMLWNTLMAVMAYFCWYYPIGLYQNAVPTHEVASRGGLTFLLIWAFMMFTSTFTHVLVAGMDSADSAGSLGNICYMLCITFCGILVKKASLPGFWTFMYYVSPFTWLASGLLSAGVANVQVVCAANEYVKFLPPAGESCSTYMAAYIASSGGYLVDPDNTNQCEYCPLRSTDDYLRTVNIRFEDAWRNWGIVLAYVVVNALGALAVYWLITSPAVSLQQLLPNNNLATATMGAKIPETTVKNGEALLEHTATNADTPEELEVLEKRLRRKIDLRLCSICGILMSLNLVDSGILSSASVTSLFDDLHLYGSRYSVSIFIFSIALVACQLPGALAVRWLGPRVLLSATTVCFGLVTLCTAFIQTWQQMIAMRVLLGIAVAPVLPGASYLVSSWYPRREQGLRYAILQVFQTCVMATGTLISFGLNHLDGRAGLRGWRWMYLVHGLAATVIGIVSYWWMVDFPENAQKSFCFLSEKETQLVVARIDRDRRDVIAEHFAWRRILVHLVDPKAYLFATMGFVGNMVSTTLSYFLPIIIQGMGFSSNMAILLSTPPYYWAVIPVVCTCFLADRWRLRGPFVVFNCSCIIAGILMIGLPPESEVARRYAGAFLGTGAFVSNWAMQYAYLANNMAGQWKRATSIAIVTTFQGLGAVAGSYVVRQQEAPRYPTAVWAITGLQILTIVIVGVLTVYFYLRNRQQRVGRHIIQNIAGFRYTY